MVADGVICIGFAVEYDELTESGRECGTNTSVAGRDGRALPEVHIINLYRHHRVHSHLRPLPLPRPPIFVAKFYIAQCPEQCESFYMRFHLIGF